jgi:hypothetical protein
MAKAKKVKNVALKRTKAVCARPPVAELDAACIRCANLLARRRRGCTRTTTVHSCSSARCAPAGQQGPAAGTGPAARELQAGEFGQRVYTACRRGRSAGCDSRRAREAGGLARRSPQHAAADSGRRGGGAVSVRQRAAVPSPQWCSCDNVSPHIRPSCLAAALLGTSGCTELHAQPLQQPDAVIASA